MTYNNSVPSTQLPAFVDDVLEFASLSSFPNVGEANKLYVATDTNFAYCWIDGAYVVISAL